jgi:hypothetical protein
MISKMAPPNGSDYLKPELEPAGKNIISLVICVIIALRSLIFNDIIVQDDLGLRVSG